MNKKEIINNLVKDGAALTKGLKVMRATLYEDEEKRQKLCFTLDKDIDMFKPNDDGDFVMTKGNTCHAFVNQVLAVLEENEKYRDVLWRYREEPKRLQTLLSGATIDIIGEHVMPTNTEDPDDEGYVNPFSKNGKPSIVENENIFYSVVQVVLTQKATNRLEELYKELS